MIPLTQEEAKDLYQLISACWLKGGGHDVRVEADTETLTETIGKLEREVNREDSGFGEGRL